MKKITPTITRTALIASIFATTFATTGCASHRQPGQLPQGQMDPATGVVRPDNGGIPFYPGDLELRSVPSMPRVPKRNPAVRMALWTEELIGRQGAHLYARNDTDVPMRIVKVSVDECINIEAAASIMIRTSC